MTKGRHVMLTMGGDFQYESATQQFTNLDKLMHFTNLQVRCLPPLDFRVDRPKPTLTSWAFLAFAAATVAVDCSAGLCCFCCCFCCCCLKQ